ncbi:DUF4301 family protein [Lacinutrix neustonica]|uniref:DUF4301 family protein n=1 Tax=Lacinutrix neustonica TaxID=2980107 RepID=UPI0028BD36CC|nr:DUF4301 family protein [Lacinutrix neustonica]
MNFTETHIKQIETKDLTVEKVKKQLDVFKTGLPYVNLKSAAVLNDGILQLSEKEKCYFLEYYDNKKEGLDILKFVPASWCSD